MRNKITFTSSVAGDIWHKKSKPEAHEIWYFDALSDDGSEAVVVTFLDNSIFSRNYNSRARNIANSPYAKQDSESSECRFPALEFAFYKDGSAIYRTISEYSSGEFSVEPDGHGCTIGNSSFQFKSAPYGEGYVITIDAKLGRSKRLKANFEWLSIESDFTPEPNESASPGRTWNIVAPRSDVTGRITELSQSGETTNEIHFRGTGYHDHAVDDRWLPKTLKTWQRGRVHFPDSTVVFCRYHESGSEEAVTKLLLVKNGELSAVNATSDAKSFSRNLFRIKYPSRFNISDSEKARLKIKQKTIVDSSFVYIRFLSEMILSLDDGKPRKGIGITEHFAPRALRNRWLDWMTGLRIRR